MALQVLFRYELLCYSKNEICVRYSIKANCRFSVTFEYELGISTAMSEMYRVLVCA